MTWTAPSGHVFAMSENVSAATLNTYIQANLTYLYGDLVWTVPTLTNGWTTPHTVAFKQVGSLIIFRGNMTPGTYGSAAFTLPAGYRPPTQVNGAATASGGATAVLQLVQVNTTGTVVVAGSGTALVWLDSLWFDTLT